MPLWPRQWPVSVFTFLLLPRGVPLVRWAHSGGAGRPGSRATGAERASSESMSCFPTTHLPALPEAGSAPSAFQPGLCCGFSLNEEAESTEGGWAGALNRKCGNCILLNRKWAVNVFPLSKSSQRLESPERETCLPRNHHPEFGFFLWHVFIVPLKASVLGGEQLA